ncbi:hypothetical protein E4U55_000948 [Claviceps digitariae]|nr:hypothetical protein E4U55_000948 [Claviceps digitariae]
MDGSASVSSHSFKENIALRRDSSFALWESHSCADSKDWFKSREMGALQQQPVVVDDLAELFCHTAAMVATYRLSSPVAVEADDGSALVLEVF